MTLENIKNMLAQGGFSPEALEAMNAVLASAEARGSITEEEKQKLLGLIDLETDVAEIEATAMEDAAMALEGFAAEAGAAVAAAQEELKAAEDGLLAEIGSITPDTVSA